MRKTDDPRTEAVKLLVKAINILLIAEGYEVRTEERGGWTAIAYRLPAGEMDRENKPKEATAV